MGNSPAARTEVQTRRRYGQFMRPLDVNQMPSFMRVLYLTDQRLREWIELSDKVGRAEFVSHWSDWTVGQTDAYRRGDMVEFSRLRGYTEEEIADFLRYVELTRQIDLESKEPDFCCSLEFEIRTLVMTPELQAIDDELVRKSATMNPQTSA